MPALKIYKDNFMMEFGIEKKGLANNEKLEFTNDGRNRTTKSRKNRNARRKGNLKILGNIESGYYQTSRDEGKNFLIPQENKITTRNQNIYYLPAPPLEQDMTQGHFLSGV